MRAAGGYRAIRRFFHKDVIEHEKRVKKRNGQDLQRAGL